MTAYDDVQTMAPVASTTVERPAPRPRRRFAQRPRRRFAPQPQRRFAPPLQLKPAPKRRPLPRRHGRAGAGFVLGHTDQRRRAEHGGIPLAAALPGRRPLAHALLLEFPRRRSARRARSAHEAAGGRDVRTDTSPVIASHPVGAKRRRMTGSAKQSTLPSPRHGLLRCARNDGASRIVHTLKCFISAGCHCHASLRI